jgi:hypothetical protein
VEHPPESEPPDHPLGWDWPVAPSEPVLAPVAAPRRRVGAWLLAGVAALLAVVLGATYAWQGPLRHEAHPRLTGSTAPTASATASTSAIQQRNDAVGAVLTARSRAVLGHDKAGFMALVDPAAAPFRSRQSTVFDRIAKVPLQSWTYDFAGEGPTLSHAQAAALPNGSWVARVILHYTYAEADSAVDREQLFTLVPRGTRWLLAGDDAGAGSQPDIWDLGPVTVVRGKSSLVIGAGTAATLRRYARDADQSVADVRRVWKGPWSRRPVVIVPRTLRDMAALIDSQLKGLDQIAAVTTGYSVSGVTRGNRVVINPAAYKSLGQLGRRVVMAHEVTHVATRAVTYHSVPIWMTEGLADYVAYRAVRLPTRVVARELLAQVRAGHAPRELPGDADFDATRGDLAPAYEGAWLACQMISQRYGEKKLLALYVAFADRSAGLPEKDIKALLGISEEKLVADWRAYLAAQARR